MNQAGKRCVERRTVMRTGDHKNGMIWRGVHAVIFCLAACFAVVCLFRLWCHIKPVTVYTVKCTPFDALLDLNTALLCESDTGRLYYLSFSRIGADSAECVTGRFPHPTNNVPTIYRYEKVSLGWDWGIVSSSHRIWLHVGDMLLSWMPPSHVFFGDDTIQRAALIPVSEISNPAATNNLDWVVPARSECYFRTNADAAAN